MEELTRTDGMRPTPRFDDWFDRCIGAWTSHRRYLMGPKKSIDNLVTDFETVKRGPNEWAVLWESDRNQGEMSLVLKGRELHRSRNYFEGEEGTVTLLDRIDYDTVVFHSNYGGMHYREEIRFLDDNFRLRQTVGRKEDQPYLNTKGIIVVGQYAEYRL